MTGRKSDGAAAEMCSNLTRRVVLNVGRNIQNTRYFFMFFTGAGRDFEILGK
jgi:hypothetical protein